MFRKRIDVTLEALQGILLELWTEAVKKSVIKSFSRGDLMITHYILELVCFFLVLYCMLDILIVLSGDFKT